MSALLPALALAAALAQLSLPAAPGASVPPLSTADASVPPLSLPTAWGGPGRGSHEAPPASPLLPANHWALRAAERLHALGLAPDWLPAQRAAPVAAVARTLEAAAARAEAADPAVAPLARAWVERLAAEYPGLAAPARPFAPALLGGSAALGFTAGSFREAVPPSTAPGTLRLTAPASEPFAALGADASLGPHLAAGFEARAAPSDAHLQRAELVAALGAWALSLGRAPVGYGPNETGAVVASGRAALDRLELMTTAPLRLPGALGDLAFDTALARLSGPRHPYHPLLWELELQWRPFPRLTLGAIRGVMFGGALWADVPARDIPFSVLGLKNAVDNNVYSGSIEWLLPTDALLPLTLALEWGSDDNPGAAFTWPGLVVGLRAPLLPGLPAAVGVEYAYFGRGLGWHEPFGWYSNGEVVGGWATGQTALGDPLGGNGRALRLTAEADPWGGRVRLRGVAWVQERFADNLYAPAAAGRSAGAQGEAEWRWGRWALGVRGGYERGSEGWRRGEVGVEGRGFF